VIDRKLCFFHPRGPHLLHPTLRDPFARTLALHLHRGDYLVHCQSLAAWTRCTSPGRSSPPSSTASPLSSPTTLRASTR
jgi:hypothetical protein